MKITFGIKMSCEEKQIIEKMINLLTNEMYNSSREKDFFYLLFGDEGYQIYDFEDISRVLGKILDYAI